MDIKEIAEMLNKYPDIKERLKEMMNIMEGPNRGEFSTVDAIEEQTVGVVRSLGRNLMQNWATQQSSKTSSQIRERIPSAKKNTKKKSIGKQPLEK
jgi:hypothetical protein